MRVFFEGEAMEYNKLISNMVPGDEVEGFYMLKSASVKTANKG